MVTRIEEKDEVSFVGDGGTGRVTVLGPGVVLVALVGKGAAEIDREVIAKFSEEIQRTGELAVFCDLRSLSRLAMETRDRASEWGREHKGRFEVNLLISSKLVEMAASVISMMMGLPFGMYSDEKQFVAAIQHKVPSFRRLPELPKIESKASARRG
jgi:hypothetical protein